MTASGEGGPNAGQISYWNETAGPKWVRRQAVMDALFEAPTERLLAHARPAPGERALDIRCGAGAVSLAAAARVGPNGSVLGVDVSTGLLARAEARRREAGAEALRFVEADAQTYAFEPGGFDLMISRLGVMFFADPTAAFANIRRALKPGGRASFGAFAALEGNPWFRLAGEACAAETGVRPPAPGRAPGPMAFAEIAYVVSILEAAGFGACEGVREDLELRYPGGADDAAEVCVTMGPTARTILEIEAGPETVAAITARLRATLAEHEREGCVFVPAQFNFFSATA